LAIAYFLGPRAKYKQIDKTPIIYDIPLDQLDAYIEDKESEIADIKEGNEAKVIWADSTKSKTEYSVVYLHGFSASHEEGAPLHTEFAKRYGANLYLSRLYDHGRRSKDAFKNMLPEDLINSAKEAIAIGRLLGDKIILISCSTGGTFSAILAPEDNDIHSLIMYSPNIDLFDPTSNLVVKPWGREILEMVMGGEYNNIAYDSLAASYWSESYHIDGIVALKYLIKEEMTKENFSKIDIPIYMGYYYKDEENQDQIVSVPKMLDFYNQISTSENLKRKETLNMAGRHVMTSYVMSDHVDEVQTKAFGFADEVLGLIKK